FWPLVGDRYTPEQKPGGPKSNLLCQAFLAPQPLPVASPRCRPSKRRDRIADATRKEFPTFVRRSSEAGLPPLPGGQGKQSCRRGGNSQCKRPEQGQYPTTLFHGPFISAEHGINEAG